MGRLTGKVAVITGAARGMGSAHAKGFVAEGAAVVVTDVRVDEGNSFVATLGDKAIFLEHDVTDAARWSEVIALSERKFGPVNVLVNNAGAGCYRTLDTITLDEYQKCVALNQFSVFYGMKAVLPSMRKAGGGSIVNISSSMGLISSIKVFAYSAAKFAVRGMSKAAAIELGSENIRVNTVFPGSIRTPAFEEFLAIAGDVSDSLLTGRVPLNRVAKIDEVTGMVIFLASDESSYCTGGDFAVDGGLTAG